MNKEEIKVMIKDCVYSEDGITYMSNKQYNNYINVIEQLQQENQSLKKENKILRENAENNDKVVDKVNWENLKLKKQLEEANEKILLLQASEPMLEYKKALEENQQKEFIEFLESYLKLFDNNDIYEDGYYDCIEEVLLKYKEMVSNNVESER